MKYIYKFIAVFVLASFSSMGQNYDLNLKVTKNERSVGGDFWVMVQVRSTPTISNCGNFSQGLLYNQSALTMNNPPGVGVDGVLTSDLTFNAGLGNPFVNSYFAKIGQNATNELAFGFSLGSGQTTNLSIASAWVDIVELRFTIASLTEKLGFENLGTGANAAAQQWDNTAVAGSPVAQTFGSGSDQIIYNGSWSGGNGAAGEPDATDAAKELLIASGNPTINGDAEVDYFEVANGSVLTLAPGATMRPYNQDGTNYVEEGTATAISAGQFVLDANNSGDYGQYLGPAINGTIRQFMKGTDGWRNVGIPMSTITAYDLGGAPKNSNLASTSYNASPDAIGSWGNEINTVNIYEFTGGESTEPHEWYGANPSTGGLRGLSVYLASSGPFATTGIIEAQGKFYDGITAAADGYQYSSSAPHASASGSQSAVVDAQIPESSTAIRKSNWDGWALITNPYPCGLNVTEFASDNGIDAANIRIWDRTATGAVDGYKYQTASGLGVTEIPTMQSFWIKKDPQVAANLVWDNDQRAFSTAAFSKTTTVPDQVKLMATNVTTGDYNSARLILNPMATPGYDQLYDAFLLAQPGNTMPSFGFQEIMNAGNGPFTTILDVNSIPYPGNNDNFPVIFSMGSAGPVEWSVDKDLLPSGLKVYIEDKVIAPGVNTEITATPYAFNHNPATDPDDRFVVHFTPYNSINIEENGTISGWMPAGWFSSSDELVLKINGAHTPQSVEVTVSDMSGKIIDNVTHVTSKEVRISADYAQGMYLVMVRDEANGDVRNIKVMK